MKNHEYTISQALNELKSPDSTKHLNRYTMKDRLVNLNATIIYERQNIALYHYRDYVIPDNQKSYLSYYCIALTSQKNSNEVVYEVDGLRELEFVKELLQKGYRIRYPNGNVYDPIIKKDKGCVWHYILAQHYNVSVEEVISARIINTVRDFKEGDLTYKSIKTVNFRMYGDLPQLVDVVKTGSNSVNRIGNDIVIWNYRADKGTYIDYVRCIYDLLKDPQACINYHGKDRRLSIKINGRFEYLYHVRMAVQLHGNIQTTVDDLPDLMKLFRTGYLENRNEVDHLDDDCDNNRLSNLMLLTKKEHSRKTGCKFTRHMKPPYFRTQKRVDDTHIKLNVGFRLADQSYSIVEGTYPIEEYLTQLKTVNRIMKDITSLEIVTSQK